MNVSFLQRIRAAQSEVTKGRTTFLSGFSQMGKLLPISYTELRFNPWPGIVDREKKEKKEDGLELFLHVSTSHFFPI